MFQNEVFNKLTILKLVLIPIVAAVVLPGLCRGQDKDNQKIAAACRFEPDWRPTNVHDGTLQVSDVNRTIATVAIDGTHYTLENSACEGRDCSRWTPKVDAYYPATITDELKYTPSCLKTPAGWVENDLHKELPAKRKLCISFGKMKVEKFQFGANRTSEFGICYDVPAVTQRPPDKHGNPAPTPTYHVSKGVVYCENWVLNKNGAWEDRVQKCSK